MGLSRWNNGEILRTKTKCQHLPGNRSRNSHGNFRDEFDGTHGIQFVTIEIFSCLVRNFFSWKCVMTLSSSSKLCTELSQNYWEAARVNERDVQLLFTGRREAKRRNSSSEMKMNVVSFSRKFYQFFPWIWRALTIFFGKFREFLVNKYAWMF